MLVENSLTMVNGKKSLNPLSALLLFAAAFFITAAILMVLWNGPVKKAFKSGNVNKIDYPTAMGLTLFIALFLPMR